MGIVIINMGQDARHILGYLVALQNSAAEKCLLLKIKVGSEMKEVENLNIEDWGSRKDRMVCKKKRG
jgi:hypothetical protein